MLAAQLLRIEPGLVFLQDANGLLFGNLDSNQVRSSIARRLGIGMKPLTPADRDVEGVVEITLDATHNFGKPLDNGRLFYWHATLFPTGRSGMTRTIGGDWRLSGSGPKQLVSGPDGRELVHFQVPEAGRLEAEIAHFLEWLNREPDTNPVFIAAFAHLRCMTIHPFGDGDGRIARAIMDMVLARAEGSAQSFYSMSIQIRQKRKTYHDILDAN